MLCTMSSARQRIRGCCVENIAKPQKSGPPHIKKLIVMQSDQVSPLTRFRLLLTNAVKSSSLRHPLFGAALFLIFIVVVFFYFLRDPAVSLMPADKSAIGWRSQTTTDVSQQGTSTISLDSDDIGLEFSFELEGAIKNPYVGVDLIFEGDLPPGGLVDLEKFSSITFTVSCQPANILAFNSYSFDSGVSTEGDFASYRKASVFFDCYETAKSHRLDLHRLEVPNWWLYHNELRFTDTAYDLRRSLGFQFATSAQSPVDIQSQVKIHGLTLHQEQLSIRRAAFALFVVFFSVIVWLFRSGKPLKEASSTDTAPPIIADTDNTDGADKEMEAVLQFMAAEYANSSMTLNHAVDELGINRNKINKILKLQKGLTFSGYLRALRLNEAARLLSQDEEYRIATIAYSVGFQNVSYFNRAFKNEFGCSPKAYRIKLKDADSRAE